MQRSEDDYGHSGGYQPSSVNVSNPYGRSAPSLMDPEQPFAHSGAVPAGFSGPEDGKHFATGDLMDDDEGPSAYSFAAPPVGPYARQRRGKWTRFKESYLTDVDWTFGVQQLLGRKSKFDGIPREIALNDPEGNRLKGFEGNSVTTGKYGPITFLPKFLFCRCDFGASD